MMAWALHMAGIEHLIHYLDDFLFLVAPHTNKSAYSFIGLECLCEAGCPGSPA